MSGQRCPICGGYSWDDGKCKFCGYTSKVKPEFNPLDTKVDIYKLAEGLKKKREQEEKDRISKGTKPAFTIIQENDDYKLVICPECHEPSLFYDKRTGKSECLNKTCFSNSSSKYLTDYIRYSRSESNPPESLNHSTGERYQFKVDHQSDFNNPFLLSVKMFLADVIYLINRKYTPEHVCSDFAKEVCEAATIKDMRCGYVVITFRNISVAHAIVAFQTIDYGLKFFEPQNGNEEDVIVGHRYSVHLDGVPEDNLINRVKIKWNDGTTTII